MTQQTPVDETVQLDYETEPEEDWLEDEPTDETPLRPRRKLFSPVPVTLFAILLTACGFLAGIEVEKGQTSSGSGGGLPAGLAALRSRAVAGKTSSSGATGARGGFPGAGGFADGLTTGEVSFANGNTLYVTNSEGNTVKVSAPKGTTVSKTVTTNVHSIHPGDTVIVRGTQHKNGSVSANSITVSSAGGSSASGAGGASTGGAATQQLFGPG